MDSNLSLLSNVTAKITPSSFDMKQLKTVAGGNGVPGSGLERDQLKSAKIAVLKLINEHKDILFGRASETLTREMKEAKWAEVGEHAHEVGAIPWHRTWDYLKDTTWQNWRKRFVEKRDKKEKFEKMGLATKVLYDEADLLIMEILDSVNPAGRSSSMSSAALLNNASSGQMNGEGQIRDISELLEIEFDVKAEEPDMEDEDVTDGPPGNPLEMHDDMDNHIVINSTEGNFESTYENATRFQNGQGSHSSYLNGNGEHVTGSNSVEEDGSPDMPSIISTSSLSTPHSRATYLRKTAYASLRSGNIGRKRPITAISGGTAINVTRPLERELMDLKCKKIRAELDLLNRESYKKDLEILQLERSLGLPASTITQKFYKASGSLPHGSGIQYSKRL